MSDGELYIGGPRYREMAEEEITVAEVTGDSNPGAHVSLPVVELLTGRGFITGKSGSGKSNSASVVIERLLDEGFPVLVVDIDGEYYGLKEEYEILHVGGDEECDIQVGPEHAERIAALALEQNVPIILDVSSFLDEEVSRELLTEVTKQLFAKEKKLKQPFLLIVEEVHEWIPEGSGLDECGRMLIKIGKRGRKHGLGITGISQRPADVKKDFITQCDWLVWHRLTWQNDTKVVRRVLDGTYAEAVEDLADGEGFLVTDWSETVRRVQFHRKETFDAGATPGLDDFERPELKSVSDDLVSELQQISETEARREDEIESLREQLRQREQRIRDLEEELAEARDLSHMADKFAEAMIDHADATDFEQRTLEEAAAVAEGTAVGDAPDAITATTDTTGVSEDENSGERAPSDWSASADGDWPNAMELEESAEPAGNQPAGWPDDGPDECERPIVSELRRELAAMDETTRDMLAYYRDHGPAAPVDVHVACGASGDRHQAYARNRRLRQAGLVEHTGRGQYDYALHELIATEHGDRLDREEIEAVIVAVEDDHLPAPGAAWPAP